MAIHLGGPLPARSGNLPGRRPGNRPYAFPIWFCSRWGLPCHPCYQGRGALLPHPFTLACGRSPSAVCFLWHFPWDRSRRALPATLFPWSPDFPLPRPFGPSGSGHPAIWSRGICKTGGPGGQVIPAPDTGRPVTAALAEPPRPALTSWPGVQTHGPTQSRSCKPSHQAMTRLPASGPLSHKLARIGSRALFWILGLFVWRRAGEPNQLPWQARLIVGSANLVVPKIKLTAKRMRRLYRIQAIPWNLDSVTMAEIWQEDLGEDLAVRIYRPTGHCDGGPSLLYFHGGGFAIGDLDTHDVICRYIADRNRLVVVAVDYRLAPEHKFPAQINDADRAYLWLTANVDRLGIASDRVAVGGDSAGGTLALSVALSSIRRGDLKIPAFLWMIYPWLELYGDYASYEECAADLLLAKPLTDFFRDQYLSADEDTKDPALSPGLAVDLSELPPTFIATAGHDPLRDEGFAFAARLKELGVPMAHDHRADLVHDFLMIGGVVPEAREAINTAVDALGQGVGLSIVE